MPSTGGRPSPWTVPHFFNMWRSGTVATSNSSSSTGGVTRRSESSNDCQSIAEQRDLLTDVSVTPPTSGHKKKPYRKAQSIASIPFRNIKSRFSEDLGDEDPDAMFPEVKIESKSKDVDSRRHELQRQLSGVIGEVCLISENPFRIHKMAEQGNMAEFQKMLLKDPSKFTLRDAKGRQPIHCAALKNRLALIEYILQQGGDINSQDLAGNTPLHAAVESEAIETIEVLLLRGADSSITNNKSQAPIHYAVELNRVKSLAILMKHKCKVNVLQGGVHGRTALHLAAIYDYAECAEVILADMKKCSSVTCNNGYYPIHEAAKCASARTLEVLLRWGESIGCTRAGMMKLYDAEGNDALHSAVNGGDIKAVQLCIESGARISSQQHDLSTPVHLACSQGALSIIKLMFSMQPEERAICLAIGDAQRMTPLHCAAMFNHKDIVDYLVKEGADVNALDKQHRSPLLLAASRGGWKTVEMFMSSNADITLKDACNRNVLHFIVMNGGQLEYFAPELSKSLDSLSVLLDDKDTSGCTPMHYASRNGHCKSIENLIRLGARINLKNNENQSPLHFAARYGRFNTALRLLESEKGPFIINETDGEGATPLHISSLNGHTKVVQLLLARGALLHRDHNGRTPLHLAAMNGYTQTMELLLSFHLHLLDQVDKDGNTSLHLAATHNKEKAISFLVSSGCAVIKNNLNATALDQAIQMKNAEAALSMVGHQERGFELLHIPSEIHDCIINALIIHLPEVYMGLLDRSITQSNHKKDSKDFHMKYTFVTLQPLKAQLMLQEKKYGKARPKPLCAMNTMVHNGRVELLTHPICQKYMQMKWHAYGMHFHLVNLFVYIIFLLLLTTFVGFRVQPLRNVIMNMTDTEFGSHIGTVKASGYDLAIAIAVLFFIGVNVIREAFQIYQQGLKYIFDITNFFEWVLYITSVITVIPVFTEDVCSYNISCSAIAVFLVWFNFLMSLQRFDLVGIYVVMFLEILNTLLKVLLLFSILIFAFGFAFHILMIGGNQLAFTSAPMALVRVFSMMLGDMDFMGTYVNAFYRAPLTNKTNRWFVSGNVDDDNASQFPPTLPFPYFTFTMLIIFMVLMPILLMNLLIGLAVGDIEAVRRNAHLKRIAKQVELHTELERKLPRFLLYRGYLESIEEYPNRPKCSHSLIWTLVQKMCGNFCTLSNSRDTERQCEEEYMIEEMEKQKNRLKDISTALNLQHNLLRLIVQKMEIRTEADDFDEGTSIGDAESFSESNKWKSPTFRRKIRSAYTFRRTKTDI